MDPLLLLVAFLSAASIIFLAIIAYLAIKYWDLKTHTTERAMEIFNKWRTDELQREAQILFENWRQEYEGKVRKEAIDKSKSVILGKITEHLIPYFPEFKYNPKDARFIGTPVDLIVFDGLDEGQLKEVVLIEVKTGISSLSKRERMIRDAVNQRRVRYEVLRLENEGKTK